MENSQQILESVNKCIKLLKDRDVYEKVSPKFEKRVISKANKDNYVEFKFEEISKELTNDPTIAKLKYPVFVIKDQLEWLSNFANKYRSLFVMILNKYADDQFILNLKKMLAIKDKVDNNNLSQEDASVQVGTMLVDKYIKPKLDKQI